MCIEENDGIGTVLEIRAPGLIVPHDYTFSTLQFPSLGLSFSIL